MTRADGVNSLAIGVNTIATGDSSVAMGYGTKSQAISSVTIGHYNKANSSESTDENYAFVIGNGTGSSDTLRKDAFTVKFDGETNIHGKTIIAGDLVVEGEISGDGIGSGSGSDINLATLSGDFYNIYNRGTETLEVRKVKGDVEADNLTVDNDATFTKNLCA